MQSDFVVSRGCNIDRLVFYFAAFQKKLQGTVYKIMLIHSSRNTYNGFNFLMCIHWNKSFIKSFVTFSSMSTMFGDLYHLSMQFTFSDQPI